jgi:hypothetical protein
VRGGNGCLKGLSDVVTTPVAPAAMLPAMSRDKPLQRIKDDPVWVHPAAISRCENFDSFAPLGRQPLPRTFEHNWTSKIAGSFPDSCKRTTSEVAKRQSAQLVMLSKS